MSGVEGRGKSFAVQFHFGFVSLQVTRLQRDRLQQMTLNVSIFIVKYN